MYVFREGRRSVYSEDLRRALARALATLNCFANDSHARAVTLDALLRAGELECVLADCGSPQLELAARISDILAAQLVSRRQADLGAACDVVDRLQMPAEITVSVAEGFAYYALHPLQYARLVEGITFPGRQVAVIGIRSIGTTLSAVVKAALEKRGLHAERITVRPQGHPFDRVTYFSAIQQQWIERQQEGHFLIVDEGPGLSGSSFLSVAEAVVAAGVACERVTLLCARQPDPGALCARDAARRVRQFTWCAVPSSSEIPKDAGVFIGAGNWRSKLAGAAERGWPASWTSMERAKFLSRDEQCIYKFEGLGHYGSAVHARAQVLQDAGWAPRVAEPANGSGYVAYSLIHHDNLHGVPVSPKLLDGIARYCAFRARAFPYTDARQCEKNRQDLELMLRTNFIEEFGSPPELTESLEIVTPVIADGRMQPWEWATDGGKPIKFDAASHGDDHFFPGPADIAWDLAGAVVEFSLHAEGEVEAIAGRLLESYEKQSGDDARSRLPAYLLAYSAFRLGYCKMAAEAMRGSEEEQRLRRDYLLYRDFAARMLACGVAA